MFKADRDSDKERFLESSAGLSLEDFEEYAIEAMKNTEDVDGQDNFEYYCEECGAKINESDNFCPKCGIEFEDEEQ